MGNKTALLVVDVQVAMFDESDPPFAADVILTNIRGLLNNARAADASVIFVRHQEASYPPMQPGNAGWQVHPALAPASNDSYVDKQACDAFHGTPLEQTLRDRGIDHLVIAGLQTELCIDTGCRSALHRDFNVTLAADAHTTWIRGTLSATEIIAHHNSSLADIPHPSRKINVRPSAEIEF